MKNPEDARKPINARLLRRVQRAILKWPKSFDINDWGSNFEFHTGKRAPDCGTEKGWGR